MQSRTQVPLKLQLGYRGACNVSQAGKLKEDTGESREGSLASLAIMQGP